jgi:tetratricopeptide (TPR) repeat protein
MSFEIVTEPTNPVPKDVEPLAVKAHQALLEGDGAAAESLLDKALERHPDDPSLAFNRSVAIQLQGREEEAMAIVREIHSRHSDYLFARVRLSEDAVSRRDFDQAQSLLDPLVKHSRFHLSEYTMLCHAQIDFLSAKGETEAARMWLRMWQDVAPDDERTHIWSARLSKRGWLRKIFQKQITENQ